MSTTIIGFPRLGEFRELKFTTEKYFRKEISEEELLAAAKDLRAKHWNIVKEKGITEIPSNDFSHYDNFLDAAFLFLLGNHDPKRSSAQGQTSPSFELKQVPR